MDYDNEALRSFLSQHHLDSLLHVNFSWDQDCLVESLQKVDVISNAICCWNQLHTLSVKELTPAALTHIATLPDLQSLVLKDVRNSQAMAFPAFAFPSLNCLDIECKDVQLCIDIVKALSSCCLTCVSFKFRISPDGRPLINSLASTHAFHTSLREITLDDPSNDTSGALSGLGYGIYILSSLFVFSNLTSVNLTLHNLDNINDDVMETLSKTWPQLQYLSLRSFSSELPVTTLMCLVPLAKFCSELEELNLYFHALWEDYDPERWAGVRNTSFHSLHVGLSPIDDHKTQLVIRFLLDIFPNITDVLYDYFDDEPTSGWEEVDEELRQRRAHQ
jgi:hypothetical protein